MCLQFFGKCLVSRSVVLCSVAPCTEAVLPRLNNCVSERVWSFCCDWPVVHRKDALLCLFFTSITRCVFHGIAIWSVFDETVDLAWIKNTRDMVSLLRPGFQAYAWTEKETYGGLLLTLFQASDGKVPLQRR